MMPPIATIPQQRSRRESGAPEIGSGIQGAGRGRWLGVVATLLVAVALAACSMSRPAPVKRMFLLEVTAPATAASTRPVSVRVGAIGVAASFRGRTFTYRRSDVGFESDFYNEFFITPAPMIAEETAKALEAAKLFRRVIAPGAPPEDSDFVLDGFVSELYGDLREAGKPTAVLTATFYLSAANTLKSNVVWSREYRQRIVAADSSPEALARAWNTALTTVLGELARDLGAASLPAS